jgi:hypothetical protein
MVSVRGVRTMRREHPRRRSLDRVVETFLSDCRAAEHAERDADFARQPPSSARAAARRPPTIEEMRPIMPPES